MADVDIALHWEGRGMEFSARGKAGREVPIDGNTQSSISPVETLLISLASCMASDILEITSKMRVPIGSLDVSASGMRNPEPPRRYLSARVVFTVGGVSDADMPKLERAVELSREKYCSVIHTLRPDLPVTLELVRAESGALT